MAEQVTNPNETNDKEIDKEGLSVLRCIKESKQEAEAAKRRRNVLNRINTQAYMGQQDYSYKQKGQSREFLPKVPMAVEQFSAFVKNSMVQFGDWFSGDVPPNSALKDFQIRELMKCYLGYLADGMRDQTSFALRVSDACKVSLMEAVMTFKIHGYKVPEPVFTAERKKKFSQGRVFNESTLNQKFRRPWRLAIDLVRAEDYFPDPTGRKLYEIHRTERDFHDVDELASQKLYDGNVLDRIASDFDDRTKLYQDSATRNQQGVTPPPFRKTVVIDEYWGDLLDSDGNLIARNIVCAMANEKYLIRPPEKNPYWHGESPFVSFPLIRVPDTVWHKALLDHASPLNFAINEVYNLMLDGGLAAVWGIKQLRSGGLVDPRQVTSGIAQGATLVVNDEFPMGEKVLETVSTGVIPPEALAIFNLGDKELQAAVMSSDLKMGHLPTKEVKATEIVEIQQSQAITLTGITNDMEVGIDKILDKSWLTIIQNADDLDSYEVVSAIGMRPALMLSRMSPAERFAAFARGYGFKARGLSATLARSRDFQKRMALWQVISQTPPLLESYLRRYDADQDLEEIMKALNINPERLALKPEAAADVPNRVNRMVAMQQAGIGGKAGQTANPQGNAGPQSSVPAEVQQATNPMSGMTG